LSAPTRIVQLEQENAQLNAQPTLLSCDYDNLKHQLDWLKRQLFGEKSEKRLDIDPAIQGNLLSALGVESPPPKEPDTETITYQRRKKTRDGALNDSGLRFSDDVPREVFVLKDPEFESLPEDQREVIGEKVSFRLAQAGIQVSRTSLTNWTSRAIDLLEPIVDAQCHHLLQSKVLAMDETPIKAGKQKKGKMRQAYLWPMYGEDDEIVFRYAQSRAHRYVRDWLKDYSGTLLSDGYKAYSAYARQNDQVTHAQCWSHCRRKFEQAKESEPEASTEALALIGAMYRHEQIIRDQQLTGAAKLAYRTKHIERVGIIQSLLVTCKLQGIDPYTYLVDVLQRISIHPASRVMDLTPREWKSRFAENPMKSDLALAGS